ncbi:MAG: hypothetical protein WCC84_03080 [Candidatus Cybelea sp.]
MRISGFARRALGIGAALALLSGCGGSQVGSLPPAAVGAAGKIEPNTGLGKLKWSVNPPYSVRTKDRYFRGTVPVVIAGFNAPGGALALTLALLDHTDSSGDYALYYYDYGNSGPVWWSAGVYVSSIILDAGQPAWEWGITKRGAVWSTFNTGKWIRYFDNYTSLAVRIPTDPNPYGYLFATSSKSKTNGSSARGPSGPTLMLYDPSKPWPHGAWRKTGWGAEQVAGDPGIRYGSKIKLYLEVAALDENGDVWKLSPVVKSHRFERYSAVQLGTVECSASHPEITFEEVAANNDVFFALDRNEKHAIWSYEPHRQCWDEIGSKRGFTSITTFFNAGFWAVDAKGNLWNVY